MTTKKNSRITQSNQNAIEPASIQAHHRIEAIAFSGPLPPPELLNHYNEIIPNGADRIMTMAERQSQHREKLESMVVASNIKAQSRGQFFSFVITIVTIICGFYLIHEGKNVEGLVAIIVALGSLLGIFIFSRMSQDKERSEKDEAGRKPAADNGRRG